MTYMKDVKIKKEIKDTSFDEILILYFAVLLLLSRFNLTDSVYFFIKRLLVSIYHLSCIKLVMN